MTWFVKVENGVVIQKQPYHEDGFIEAPEWVIVGYLYGGETFTAPPISEPEPMPYTLPVALIWLRMANDDEVESFDIALSVATPLRLRRAFNTATSLHSSGELFAFVKNILAGVFGTIRAQEIIKEPDTETLTLTTEEPEE